MKYNYLEYYYSCMETGFLEGEILEFGHNYRNGLCNELKIDKELLSLFKPSNNEREDDNYWAQEKEDHDSGTKFNVIRQNIVLFMAAMKGQL